MEAPSTAKSQARRVDVERARKLPHQTLTELAATADEQARHLNELTRWAFESGVERDLTDDQIIALMRHQSAIATLLLTLTSQRAAKA